MQIFSICPLHFIFGDIVFKHLKLNHHHYIIHILLLQLMCRPKGELTFLLT